MSNDHFLLSFATDELFAMIYHFEQTGNCTYCDSYVLPDRWCLHAKICPKRIAFYKYNGFNVSYTECAIQNTK